MTHVASNASNGGVTYNRALEVALRDTVMALLSGRVEVGFRRAVHAAAFAELAYRAYFRGHTTHDGSPGFFDATLRSQIEQALHSAKLRKTESAFRDILQWDIDKKDLALEMRENLIRLLDAPSRTVCITDGLAIHVRLDMLMKNRYENYLSAIRVEDFARYPHLCDVQVQCERLIGDQRVPALTIVSAPKPRPTHRVQYVFPKRVGPTDVHFGDVNFNRPVTSETRSALAEALREQLKLSCLPEVIGWSKYKS